VNTGLGSPAVDEGGLAGCGASETLINLVFEAKP
jgi:hypothetical protein